MSNVRAWSERIIIPTYPTGEPNPYPMFLENRVYQGSSGVVYPYPVVDSVGSEKEDREWTAVYVENQWIKVMILPELGGRVQMALDKTNNYHFIYHNRVIKPALVGLAGPWISGGIEFNWPQHHRPTTYSPVDWMIEEHEDGSVTVWCSEIEPMFRMKGTHGLRLRPNRAALEVHVRICNRTSEPQTFLWWANPAVSVHDDYQSVFPPDVQAVMDHGKRDVSEFPIARGRYYKVDYSPGTDISRYKNIPVPTSYMAYHSDYNFIGCYDHARGAGMMHVANHHVVPGKKQWTWGCGEFGRAWDRELTDEDGPYIELMCGAFTDNQPDFTWLVPGEEKSFVQTFLPYKEIGPASNACAEAVVALDISDGKAHIGVYATGCASYTVELWHNPGERSRIHNHKNMNLPRVEKLLSADATIIFATAASLSPQKIWNGEVPIPGGIAPEDVTLRVLEGRRLVIEFTAPSAERPIIPRPAEAARVPRDIESSEELFLTGLHLEQYRHALWHPEPYYEEALKRDPGDSRCNNAVGKLCYKRAQFAEAELYFRRAIERLTTRNPNPCDGEAHYNLGLALKMQGRREDAYDVFYKAAWSEAQKAPAHFELARLDAWMGRFDSTLLHLEECLARNAHHAQARHLRIAALRLLQRVDEARAEAEETLRRDPFNFGAKCELHFMNQSELRGSTCPTCWIETGLDYLHSGLFAEARTCFEIEELVNPMSRYYIAWTFHLEGLIEEAQRAAAAAANQTHKFFSPNQIECVAALEAAMKHNCDDVLAPYALGNYYYAHRRYDDAIAAWECAASRGSSYPGLFRNLGLACMNKKGDGQAARAAYARAYSRAPEDARILFELDQLERKLGSDPMRRLEFLTTHSAHVEQRDDLTCEHVCLLNFVGRHREALDCLLSHRFHPWEGGEGKASGQYVAALVELAKEELSNDRAEDAIELLRRACTYPPNLAEGRLPGARDNAIYYWMGKAHESLNEMDLATTAYQRACAGASDPAQALYYNDDPPEALFYQALAHRALGRVEEAEAIASKLISYGNEHRDDAVQVDYFAVSLPSLGVFDDEPSRRNRIHCTYLIGLGYLARGHAQVAIQYFDTVLSDERDHLGAMLMHRAAARICS